MCNQQTNQLERHHGQYYQKRWKQLCNGWRQDDSSLNPKLCFWHLAELGWKWSMPRNICGGAAAFVVHFRLSPNSNQAQWMARWLLLDDVLPARWCWPDSINKKINIFYHQEALHYTVSWHAVRDLSAEKWLLPCQGIGLKHHNGQWLSSAAQTHWTIPEH